MHWDLAGSVRRESILLEISTDLMLWATDLAESWPLGECRDDCEHLSPLWSTITMGALVSYLPFEHSSRLPPTSSFSCKIDVEAVDCTSFAWPNNANFCDEVLWPAGCSTTCSLTRYRGTGLTASGGSRWYTGKLGWGLKGNFMLDSRLAVGFGNGNIWLRRWLNCAWCDVVWSEGKFGRNLLANSADETAC